MGAELPTPYVNTYFRILSTKRVIEIARVIGKEEDIPRLGGEIAACSRAIDTFYRNDFVRDDCYCANVRGANAFALDIGLGSDITKQKFVDYYNDLGCYDTGIFATEIVTRMLFELGRADVAYKLLTATEPRGFGKWWKDGSTTLREYFGTKCRSYSHPMFGAVVATFFEYILGIKQRVGTAAYTDVVINPVKLDALTFARGHITTPQGKIFVGFTGEGGARTYTVEIPEGIKAVFIKDGEEIALTAGKNII
jgi:alpha-L-rhamnosidase